MLATVWFNLMKKILFPQLENQLQTKHNVVIAPHYIVEISCNAVLEVKIHFIQFWLQDTDFQFISKLHRAYKNANILQCHPDEQFNRKVDPETTAEESKMEETRQGSRMAGKHLPCGCHLETWSPKN